MKTKMKIEMEINSNKINVYCEGNLILTSLCKVRGQADKFCLHLNRK
jgi:hypothetical protein